MRRIRQVAAIGLAGVAMLLAGCSEDGAETGAEPEASGFDAERAFADLETQVGFGPRPAGSEASRETAEWIASSLEEAGVEEVGVQEPFRNVVGILPGSEPGYVVVGAHHDTKDIPGFVGANDGASGVAVVLELARALPRPIEGPSIAFALFDAEEARGDRDFTEDGKRGSTRYVELAARGGGDGVPPLDEIEAMVLFDLVGDCDLKVPLEGNSDPAIYEQFASIDPATFSGTTFPIDDDHVPFVEAGVPALDVIDFDFGPGPPPGRWWHSTEDELDKVCPESLGAIGDAALAALPEIAEGS